MRLRVALGAVGLASNSPTTNPAREGRYAGVPVDGRERPTFASVIWLTPGKTGAASLFLYEMTYSEAQRAMGRGYHHIFSVMNNNSWRTSRSVLGVRTNFDAARARLPPPPQLQRQRTGGLPPRVAVHPGQVYNLPWHVPGQQRTLGVCCSCQLNGTHGEATNTDDVRVVERTGNQPAPPPPTAGPGNQPSAPNPPPTVASADGSAIVYRSRVYPLDFTHESHTVDPLAEQTGPSHVPQPATVPVEVDVVSSVLGDEPSYVVSTENGIMAVYTDTTVTFAGSAHCPAVWGAPYFVLMSERNAWVAYEYTLVPPDTIEPGPSMCAQRTWLHLAAMADLIDGLPPGATIRRLAEVCGGRHDIRAELHHQLSQHPQDLLARADAGVGTYMRIAGCSVRDAALNGNNGSATNTDDVNKPETAKQRRRRKRAEVAKAAAEQVGHTVGEAIAPGLGKYLAKPMGRAGQYAMNMLQHYVLGGSGAYTVRGLNNGKTMKVNSLFKGSVSDLGAVTFEGTTCNVVAAKDLVTEVRNHALSSGSFLVIKIPVNPGDMNRFPQLAGRCHMYEEYRPLGLAFEYKPVFSDTVYSTSSATGTLGSIAFAVQRNISEPQPTSMMSMSRMEGFYMCKLSEPCTFFVECAREVWADDMYLVKNTTTGYSLSVPRSKYDCCNVLVAVQTGNMIMNNDLLGWLSMVSHVCVSRPQAPPVVEGKARFVRTGYTNAAPLGVASTSTCTGTLVDAAIDGSNITLEGLPKGTLVEFLIVWYGTAVAWTPPSLTGTGLLASNMYVSGSTNVVALPTTGSSSIQCAMQAAYTVSCALNQIPMLTLGTSGTLPSAGVRVEVFINTTILDPVYGVNA